MLSNISRLMRIGRRQASRELPRSLPVRHFGNGQKSFTETMSEKGREKEGWENIYIYGMGGGFLFITIALMLKPDTRLEVWARDEAIARNERAKKGLPVEIGENYSQDGTYNTSGRQWKKVPGYRPKRVDV